MCHIGLQGHVHTYLHHKSFNEGGKRECGTYVYRLGQYIEDCTVT